MFRTDRQFARLCRHALRMAIAACGVATILGSGGGGMPDVDLGGCCALPSVTIEPHVRTVSVGDRVTFDAVAVFVTAPVSFRWQRNGLDIGGATGASLVLSSVNLADDGAQYTVVVSAANGSASTTALLQVSPYPAVVFEDGQFVPGQWSVAVLATPATGGPSATVSRSASGGNPDAYRSLLYDMSAGPSTIKVFHAAATATYDPATQGAIYALDAGADCLKSGSGQVDIALMVEQGGRRFIRSWGSCTVNWVRIVSHSSLRASDFVLEDGLPCAAGSTCPDFTASGAPLRLGFATMGRVFAGEAATSFTQGIDNWKINVWRR